MTAALDLLASYPVEELRNLILEMNAEEQIELAEILTAAAGVWAPLLGPQMDAYFSEADITGYGGAAGGGKTDLACGLALVDHDFSIIYRRQAAQLTAIEDRLERLLGSRVGFNGQKGVWRLGKGRQVEFGGFPNLGDEKKYQGRPHDLKVFDEVTEMLEAQVRFLMGWLRSSKRRRQRVLMTFNPPTTPEGRWVLSFFGPWLDKHHPLYPAKPGELLWCTTIDGKDEWVPDSRPFVFAEATLANVRGTGVKLYDFDPKRFRGQRQALVITPLSRTFIPAKVTDNPYYMASGYMAKLQALPEPWRSQMLFGDFEAGMMDDEWQVIPTEWVRLSMERWKARGSLSAAFRPGPMDSMGVDVAMGGDDKFVIARRHGTWFAEPLRYPGKGVTSGHIGSGLVIKHRRDRAPVHVDVIGWGSETARSLVDNGVQTLMINVSNSSMELSSEGQPFVNMRAQLVWRMREALNPANPQCVDLPDDAPLEKELTAYRYTPTRSGFQIESKKEMRKRLGYSPDTADAYCLGLIQTLKQEVVIDAVAAALQNGYGGEDGDWDRLAL